MEVAAGILLDNAANTPWIYMHGSILLKKAGCTVEIR